MKRNIGSLLLYTLLFYYVFGPVRDFIEGDDFSSIFKLLNGTKGFLLVSTSMLAFMAYTLGAYLVLFTFYKKTSKFVVGILLIAIVPLAIAFRYFVQEMLMRWMTGEGNYTDGYPLDIYFLDNLYYAFVFVSFGVIMFFIRYSQYKEKQEQQLKIENQQIQLSLLRSQVNPHFLFNALNNIYALVNENNKQSLPALEKLSSILRYSLYEQSEEVLLHTEWQKLEDYIMLESLRLPYTPAILWDVPELLPQACVPSFILIGLVENAFKHGKLDNVETPLRIKLRSNTEVIQFHISNTIATKNKDQTGGIGLKNTQDRLALLYPKQHIFSVEKTGNHFSIQLEIPYKSC